MKKLLKQSTLGALIVVLLCAFTSSMDSSAQTHTSPDNYLKIVGDVLDGHEASIMVFSYVPKSQEWVLTKEKTSKHAKYKLMVNPEVFHQIWFTDNDTGHTKILFVDPGDSGPWAAILDIDFDLKRGNYARLYQVDDKEYSYEFEAVASDYDIAVSSSLADGDSNLSSTMEKNE